MEPELLQAHQLCFPGVNVCECVCVCVHVCVHVCVRVCVQAGHFKHLQHWLCPSCK